MQSKLNTFKIALGLTVVAHSFILVGHSSWHGFGFMILLDLMIIPQLIESLISGWTPMGPAGIVVSMALSSLVGKLLILASFLNRFTNSRDRLRVIGTVLLIISYGLICVFNWDDSFLQLFSGVFGVPFLIAAVYVLQHIYHLNKGHAKD